MRTFASSSRSSGFMRLQRALPGVTRRKAGKPKWIKKKSIDGGRHNDFTIPVTLKLEHQELHANLVKATKAGARVGDAAQGGCQSSSRALKEDQVALPPLGLLSTLAAPSRRGIKEVLPISDRLKTELPKMLEEHDLSLLLRRLICNSGWGVRNSLLAAGNITSLLGLVVV